MDDDYLDWLTDQSVGLQRIAWGITGNRDRAEDLTQDALEKAIRKRRLVSAAANPSAYLRTILVNCWRDQRLLRETPLTDQSEPAVDEDTDRPADARDLARAMLDLSPQQRKIIALRFFDDQSIHDTAEILHTTQETVKSQTTKALAALRRHPRLNSYLEDSCLA